MQIKMLFSLALLVGLSSIANAELVTVTYNEYNDALGATTGNYLTFEYDDATGPPFGVTLGSVEVNGTVVPGQVGTNTGLQITLLAPLPGTFNFTYLELDGPTPLQALSASNGMINGQALGVPNPTGAFGVFTVGNTFVAAAIPEPSALAGLFLASLVGLGRRRRR